MRRSPGVLSFTSKIAQEKGRVLETLLRKGFCNNLTKIIGCPERRKQKSYRERRQSLRFYAGERKLL